MIDMMDRQIDMIDRYDSKIGMIKHIDSLEKDICNRQTDIYIYIYCYDRLIWQKDGQIFMIDRYDTVNQWIDLQKDAQVMLQFDDDDDDDDDHDHDDYGHSRI